MVWGEYSPRGSGSYSAFITPSFYNTKKPDVINHGSIPQQRKDFVDRMAAMEFPPTATTEWLNLATKLQKLAGLLGYHEAMQPNINHTYMTPAPSKNRVYFMANPSAAANDDQWTEADVLTAITVGICLPYPQQSRVGRASRSAGNDSAEREAWSDCQGRAQMSKQLILDTNRGMLDMMMASTYPGQTGTPPAFGEEVLAAAREL